MHGGGLCAQRSGYKIYNMNNICIVCTQYDFLSFPNIGLECIGEAAGAVDNPKQIPNYICCKQIDNHGLNKI